MTAARPKLVFLVTEDWFFRSHFLSRARAARDAGYEVVVAACFGEGTAWLEAEGFRAAPLPFIRGGVNPLPELGTLAAITRLYRAERPQLVHHVALKPILYGSVAAAIAGVPAIVNAPAGLGFVFTSTTRKARLLNPPVRAGLRRLLAANGAVAVFENRDDLERFTGDGCVPAERAVLIRGAGVDIDAIRPSPEPAGTVGAVLIARMLADKGVREFVEAARMLRERGSDMRFTLVGRPDPSNPASIAETELRRWHEGGAIEWLGFRDDVADLFAANHIAVLPSYREGLPKVLLEAMAAGRPIVTTDVVGCRDTVEHGGNGLLVPPRDAAALADAIERLGRDADLRRAMGAKGRRRAETEFAAPIVDRQTLELYDRLTGGTRGPSTKA